MIYCWYIVSHSLGGALATIAALDVSVHMLPRVNFYLQKKQERFFYSMFLVEQCWFVCSAHVCVVRLMSLWCLWCLCCSVSWLGYRRPRRLKKSPSFCTISGKLFFLLNRHLMKKIITYMCSSACHWLLTTHTHTYTDLRKLVMLILWLCSIK